MTYQESVHELKWRPCDKTHLEYKELNPVGFVTSPGIDSSFAQMQRLTPGRSDHTRVIFNVLIGCCTILHASDLGCRIILGDAALEA